MDNDSRAMNDANKDAERAEAEPEEPSDLELPDDAAAENVRGGISIAFAKVEVEYKPQKT